MADTKNTVSTTATQHLAELQKNATIGSGGFGAGSYGSDLQSAFTDPVSGQQVSGMGFVPLANGKTKTISDLILGARNPKNLAKIRSQLVQYGLIGKNVKSATSVQSAWQNVVINASTSQMDPTEWMKQAKAGGFGQDTATTAPNLPERQIYKYTEADRQKWIDDASQALRGQAITEEDKSQKWYQDLKASIDKMIEVGTVSTTNKVYNPKTKKTENKVVTVPGFSQEQAAATAEKAIRAATPQDVARQDRVGFTDWMFKQLGGANG
jgi:hypothetical protein